MSIRVCVYAFILFLFEYAHSISYIKHIIKCSHLVRNYMAKIGGFLNLNFSSTRQDMKQITFLYCGLSGMGQLCKN